MNLGDIAVFPCGHAHNGSIAACGSCRQRRPLFQALAHLFGILREDIEDFLDLSAVIDKYARVLAGLHFSCWFGLLWVRAGIMLRAPVIEPRRAYRCSGEAPLAYRESLVWANATAQSRHPKGWRPFLLAHINQFPRTVIVQLRGITCARLTDFH